MIIRQIFILAGICLSISIFAQSKTNYDEDAVEPYVLPELLMLKSGEKVENILDWEQKRRPEILGIYKDQIYGNIPEGTFDTSFVELIEQSDSALDNTAIRKQIAIVFRKQEKELRIDVLMYLPKNVKSPPLFIGYNFNGNHTISNDSNILLTESWVLNEPEFGIVDNHTNESTRGNRSFRWSIDRIISEGFGLATINYGDVDPDKNDFSDGIHSFFYSENQTHPRDDEWGSISAWASDLPPHWSRCSSARSMAPSPASAVAASTP